MPTEAEIALRDINAAKRRLAAIEARKDFKRFVQFMNPDPECPDDADRSTFQVAPHHRLLIESAERIESGRMTRLAISMPPRHGKSELFSRAFPAWCIGRNPRWQIIVAGYNDDFAVSEFGAKIKMLMESPSYAQVFPEVRLDGSKAAGSLMTSSGGQITSVGRGTATTGKGAHLLIVDDPIKDDKEAASQIIRDQLWDWYWKVAQSRLMPKARIVIIHTRWSDDDLLGRLLESRNGTNKFYREEIANRWVYLKLPAIFDKNLHANIMKQLGKSHGDALWPEWYPVETLNEMRLGHPRGFAALYQQEPAPEDGDYFKADMLHEYGPGEFPDGMMYYCGMDFAVTAKTVNDRNAIFIAGMDKSGMIWVMPEAVYGWFEPPQCVELVLDLWAKRKPHWAIGESGIISRSIGPYLRQRMRDRGILVNIDDKPTLSDKRGRAQGIRAMMSLGRVRFPRHAVWWPTLRDELLRFPYGRFDDGVDALAWIGIGLDDIVRRQAFQKQEESIPRLSGHWLMKTHKEKLDRERLIKATRGW